jgi:hypothetical protein
MKVEIIDPTRYPGWDDLLLSTPGYSFFHSSAWARVLGESYHYTPLYFTIIDNGKFLALIPLMEVNSILTGKRGVSLPFTDYSDVIIGSQISFKDLLYNIIEYGKSHGWKSLELRGGQNLPLLGVTSSAYSCHFLNLYRKTDEIFSNFRNSTRRNIKKAIQKGVKVEISRTLASVKEFYRLNRITRKRHGLPPQPLYFFEKVHEHIIFKNLGFVVLASCEERFIGGAVYFHFGETAVFKYGASEKRFHHFRPNNMTMWEAIKWYSQNGYKSICFGRTEPGNEGLRRFKAGWGTEERNEKYYKYDFKKNNFIKDSKAIEKIYHAIFRKTPQPFLSMIGSLFYRHVG